MHITEVIQTFLYNLKFKPRQNNEVNFKPNQHTLQTHNHNGPRIRH